MRYFLSHIIFLNSITGFCQTFTLQTTDFEVGQVMTLEELHFQFEGDHLPKESKNILDTLVMFLMKHENLKVEIGTHTDYRGSASANIRLSQQRSEFVRNYLIDKGIDSTRLVARGYGEEQPLIPDEEVISYLKIDRDKYEECNRTNRRTEIKIVGLDFCPKGCEKYILEASSIYNYENILDTINGLIELSSTTDIIKPVKIEGDWLQVKWDVNSGKDLLAEYRYGWIRWRKEDKLILKVIYLK